METAAENLNLNHTTPLGDHINRNKEEGLPSKSMRMRTWCLSKQHYLLIGIGRSSTSTTLTVRRSQGNQP